jgi:hypothetical protein
MWETRNLIHSCNRWVNWGICCYVWQLKWTMRVTAMTLRWAICCSRSCRHWTFLWIGICSHIGYILSVSLVHIDYNFAYHICAWNHVNCSWFHTKHAVVEFEFEQENMWQDVDPDNMSYEVRIFVLLAAVLENWIMHCFCWDCYNSGCQLLVYVATRSSRADSHCIAPLCMFSSHWCFWASGESREHLSFWTVLRVLVLQSMFWFWFLAYCLKYRSW